MTSELMLKLTIAFLVACVASHVAFNAMFDCMDEAELIRMANDKQRLLKHPLVMAVSVTYTLTKVAAAVSAVITAVLWLMGA